MGGSKLKNCSSKMFLREHPLFSGADVPMEDCWRHPGGTGKLCKFLGHIILTPLSRGMFVDQGRVRLSYFSADMTCLWLVSLPVVVSCLGSNASLTGAWACTGNPEAEGCCPLLGRLLYFSADLTCPWLLSLPVVISCLEARPAVTGTWSCTGNPDYEDCCSLLGTSSWL